MWKEFPNQEPFSDSLRERIDRYINRPPEGDEPEAIETVDKEYDDILTSIPPRRWNSKIMPGFVVVAIEERDPIFPDETLGDKPNYPLAESLLRDSNWIRYERLSLEASFGSKNFSLVFPKTVDQFLEAETGSKTIRANETNFSFRYIAAIRDDLIKDPRALIVLRN